HWRKSPGIADFYALKGAVEGVFKTLCHEKVFFKPARYPFLHPTRGAKIYLNSSVTGFMGAVHPAVLEHYHIEQEVFYAEVDLTSLIESERKVEYKAVPRFPAIYRDLSLVVPA